jgi:hypothetical protein
MNRGGGEFKENRTPSKIIKSSDDEIEARRKKARKKLMKRHAQAARNLRYMRSYSGGFRGTAGAYKQNRFAAGQRNRQISKRRGDEEALRAKINELTKENELLNTELEKYRVPVGSSFSILNTVQLDKDEENEKSRPRPDFSSEPIGSRRTPAKTEGSPRTRSIPRKTEGSPRTPTRTTRRKGPPPVRTGRKK